ncbi:MAG: response regulator, partial [Anaerolineae bacterium]|nr:response regulator [Anaerolineae bacterium]
MLTSLGWRQEEASTGLFAAYLTKPIKPAKLHKVLLNVFVDGDSPPADAPESLPAELRIDIPPDGVGPVRILLAEDNVVNQKVALKMLKRIGYQADVAMNGSEVLAALQRQRYDVIFMDIQMPQMDGLEATKKIRQQPADFEQPYIIAMTANALAGDREHYLASGMDDYVSKPVKLTHLVEALQRYQTQAQALYGQSLNRANGTRAEFSDIPVEADSTPDPAVDFSVLQRFQRDLGEDDPDLVKELVRDFLQDAPEHLAALDKGAGQADCDTIRHAAHTLKSSSVHMGANGLSAMCQELEMMARNGTLDGITEKVARVQSEYERVKLALERNKNGVSAHTVNGGIRNMGPWE